MKSIKISLLFTGLMAILKLPEIMLSPLLFFEYVFTFHIVGTLIDLFLLFISGLITYAIYTKLNRDFSIVKSTLVRVTIYAVLLNFLNEVLLLFVKLYYSDLSIGGELDATGTYFSFINLFANIPWTLKTGAIFTLIWIVFDKTDNTRLSK